MNNRNDGSELTSPGAEPLRSDEATAVRLVWRQWWTVLPEAIAMACTGMFPLLIVVNVIARYTDWYQVPWAENIIHVLFLWIVFLGGALAVKYEAHVKMLTIAERIVRVRAIGPWWSYVLRLSPASMGLLLLWLGIWAVKLDMMRLLTWLQIPIGYFVIVVPLSGALMIYYTAVSFYRFLAANREKRATHDSIE